jgi:hypothetical protein
VNNSWSELQWLIVVAVVIVAAGIVVFFKAGTYGLIAYTALVTAITRLVVALRHAGAP